MRAVISQLFGAEGAAELCRCPAKSNEDAAGRNVGHFQSLRLEPGADAHIMAGKAELLADLGGRQPVVVLRRSRVLLRGEQFFKLQLLLRRTSQNQREAKHNLGCG